MTLLTVGEIIVYVVNFLTWDSTPSCKEGIKCCNWLSALQTSTGLAGFDKCARPSRRLLLCQELNCMVNSDVIYPVIH